ncbi:GNAT family N-acetyltransferase [Mesorhizobium sp.]|uniref:GNAT family N-acetyltransferase n=1 Tax=Mesorhizobium sp. TaxID=1871066 RepID=UPI000FE657FF|nr:GNAT family N-acetyltransferase [Mesorhizobium sp.]RWQ16136.1 MAG: GNAT family N-acetyltransferase [Mesorhizobium sp.]
MTIELTVKPGNEFTADLRKAFEELVLLDPQVQQQGLTARIEAASYLAFLHLDGELVGTNSIKHNRKHQRTIEGHAGVLLPDAEYFGEVGYLHVAEGHRGARLGDLLVLASLAAVQGEGLFATIQSMNIGSRRLFERHGFVGVGKSWPSTKVDDQLILCIRPGK